MLRSAKPFPFLEQTGMMECGTTCLAMIFKYYGFYNIQRFLAKHAEVNTEGTDLQTMADIAEAMGFKTDAYEMEYKYLMEIKLPCIAHYDGNHFIVIYKATKKHVWVADPAYGKDKYTREEFSQNWNGIVLVLEPSNALFKNKDMLERIEESKSQKRTLFSRFYRPSIRPYRGLLFQVIIATLFGFALLYPSHCRSGFDARQYPITVWDSDGDGSDLFYSGGLVFRKLFVSGSVQDLFRT